MEAMTIQEIDTAFVAPIFGFEGTSTIIEGHHLSLIWKK